MASSSPDVQFQSTLFGQPSHDVNVNIAYAQNAQQHAARFPHDGQAQRQAAYWAEVVLRQQQAQAAQAAQAAPAAQAPDGLILPQVLDDRVYDPESYELKPLDGMRKTVAKRLTQSFMQVPHFPLNVDIQLDKLLKLRSEMNAGLEARGIKLSVNDMLIKALGVALMEVPECMTESSRFDKNAE